MEIEDWRKLLFPLSFGKQHLSYPRSQNFLSQINLIINSFSVLYPSNERSLMKQIVKAFMCEIISPLSLIYVFMASPNLFGSAAWNNTDKVLCFITIKYPITGRIAVNFPEKNNFFDGKMS